MQSLWPAASAALWRRNMARTITGQNGNINELSGAGTGAGGLGADVFGTGQYAVFTTTDTWTVPEGVTNIRVHCFGGGGGTTYQCSSGSGSGSYSYGVFSVQPGETIPIVVGNAGKGGTYGVKVGTAGGTTSCKRATAGGGGPGVVGAYGLGGVATGGIRNIDGATAIDIKGGVGFSVPGGYGTTAAGANGDASSVGKDGQPGHMIIEY